MKLLLSFALEKGEHFRVKQEDWIHPDIVCVLFKNINDTWYTTC